MKRVVMFSIMLISAVLFGVSVDASSNNEYSESELREVATFYLANSLENYEESIKDVELVESITLYDLNNKVNGYTFLLSRNGNYIGYITTSTNMNLYPIIEYSFDSLPVYYESIKERTKNSNHLKVVMLDAFNYFVKDQGVYYNVINDKSVDKEILKDFKKEVKNDKQVEKNLKLKSIASELLVTFGADYEGQLEGYRISDRFLYMSDRYGTYSYEGGSTLSGFVGLNQGDYGGANDCTLVSITEIALWYRSNGMPNVPSLTSTIYQNVLAVGTVHGYTTTGGTNPTKIDNIVEDSFDLWNYNVNATNNYIWSFSLFKNEINADRPLIFNITTGAYSNHSVSVFGYKEYDVADFLLVKDHWSTTTRYIHYQEITNDIGMVTKIV